METLDNTLQTLKDETLQAVHQAETLEHLEKIRITSLGKKGRITILMKSLGQLPDQERRHQGAQLNLVKQDIFSALSRKKENLEKQVLEQKLLEEKVDVSLPVDMAEPGKRHPITQTIDEIAAIFGTLGFRVQEGPDIEDDFYNFTALNFPPEHPARQEHDTFFLQEGTDKLLRTHTSTVQVRAMTNSKPPLRIIIPGRCFRCDYDVTHTPMFHQVEGLIIDKSTHMGHLKNCLIEFCKAYFEVDDLSVRFRPSFFPFTEPSAEVDIGCSWGKGKLSIGGSDDWLEILGCGMVDPNVIKNCGLDPEEYQGFAFGMGVERLAMLKYGIPDLRNFFDNDLRWLRHYGFSSLQSPNLLEGLS